MINSFDVILRLLVTLILCGLVGFEREVHGRAAGLRTHILVGLGACLIMLTSLYVFDIYSDVANVDPTRIAAGVVTGIGFLGAGAIIRYGEAVKGLTTAATLWIVSAIGLSIGCGFYIAGLAASVFVLVVLIVLRRFETVLHKNTGG